MDRKSIELTLGERVQRDRLVARLDQAGLSDRLKKEPAWGELHPSVDWISRLERNQRRRAVDQTQRSILARVLGQHPDDYKDLPLRAETPDSVDAVQQARQVIRDLDPRTLMRVISPPKGPRSLIDQNSLAIVFFFAFVKRGGLELYSTEPNAGCPLALRLVANLAFMSGLVRPQLDWTGHPPEFDTLAQAASALIDGDYPEPLVVSPSDWDICAAIQVFHLKQAQRGWTHNPFTYVMVESDQCFAVSDQDDLCRIDAAEAHAAFEVVRAEFAKPVQFTQSILKSVKSPR